ncbi:MAG: tetratricopeptide repeat protein [Desulfarculaceae bacterium]|nr:tetratricopeptide repeat protein [Desulfarculaceae bacterium]MCF8047545.1 tetratricopeptide repeat protein [Desulfarculaceae bacterium]MCF8064065.1 tetratricopeptide repeat protein [Desulfarculaceae bacterium]MCF8096608.1 tetratricopeptide repeat protein [Desulfarculaceae bacterium]MCF8122266.1 tetratricopeptide repeat protein [Desulfarculaceae bacterium]
MKVWLLILTLGLACCWAAAPVLAAPRPQLEQAKAAYAARYAVDKGWKYFDRGDLAGALRRFHQATIIDPAFAPGYFGKAFVYSRQKRWDLAETNYLKTMELAPEFTHAYGNLAVVYWSQGKVAMAAPYVRRALELAPTDPMVQENAAYYFFYSANYDAAWRHLKKAKALGARPDPNFVKDLRARLSNSN